MFGGLTGYGSAMGIASTGTQKAKEITGKTQFERFKAVGQKDIAFPALSPNDYRSPKNKTGNSFNKSHSQGFAKRFQQQRDSNIKFS
jgi:hypothetical protein